MKKLTLLFVAVALLSGGAIAQNKACCKKGGHCTKACSKDAKGTSKETPKATSTQTKAEAPKKTS